MLSLVHICGGISSYQIYQNKTSGFVVPLFRVCHQRQPTRLDWYKAMKYYILSGNKYYIYTFNTILPQDYDFEHTYIYYVTFVFSMGGTCKQYCEINIRHIIIASGKLRLYDPFMIPPVKPALLHMHVYITSILTGIGARKKMLSVWIFRM